MKAIAIVKPENLEQAKVVVEAYRLVYPDIELVDLTKFHHVIGGCMFLSGLMNKVKENIIKDNSAMLILDTEVRDLANPLSEYFEQIHLISSAWDDDPFLQQVAGSLPTRSMAGYRHPRNHRNYLSNPVHGNPQPTETKPKGEEVKFEPRTV